MMLVSRNAQSDLSAEQALTFVAAFYTVGPRTVGHAGSGAPTATRVDGSFWDWSRLA